MNNINFDNDDRYIINSMASIRPDKIVFYKNFVKKIEPIATIKNPISKETNKLMEKWGLKSVKQPETNKHNFNISKKAGERIREKITWLYTLAKKQTVTTHKGKILSDFKMSFITLTIPSTQKHKSSEITKDCLNQFITELAEKHNLKNYVWRLEFQKNGNIHYHIACDIFINYLECKRVWNRIIEKKGYISDYAQKFEKMNFNEYYKIYHKIGVEDYKELRGRYNVGLATHWREPNTVDTRNVSSSKKISYYISKYITKNSNQQPNPIIEERDGNSGNIRLWFCSRSLSKLTKIDIFLDEVCDLTDNIFDNLQDFQTYIHDYCKVLYFNISGQLNSVKRSFWELFNNYAKENNYYCSA